MHNILSAFSDSYSVELHVFHDVKFKIRIMKVLENFQCFVGENLNYATTDGTRIKCGP